MMTRAISSAYFRAEPVLCLTWTRLEALHDVFNKNASNATVLVIRMNFECKILLGARIALKIVENTGQDFQEKGKKATMGIIVSYRRVEGYTWSPKCPKTFADLELAHIFRAINLKRYTKYFANETIIFLNFSPLLK